ncbi:thiamine pyrophosphate-dependent dehydrogenase E1 component subunit alpha [Agrobacterium rhizogenes]|nr:thiamine pyrophosphate-dependent dehydrogenase E1 component subunit alpha [Rhizobium rhizogenes]
MIREFELSLLDLYSKGKLSGTTHTCLGQEYIPVALQPLLAEHDFVVSNHRGHGHYLARWGDPEGLLAEIMGREGALCSGVGGSQHIYRQNYLSTGIQGQSLPIAAGLALHLKRKRSGAITLVYIGDGSWGEGAVYEALNIASLWRLPLIVVVENNEIAQSTPIALHMAGTIKARALAFNLQYIGIVEAELGFIRSTLREPIISVRKGGIPLIIEFNTHRLGPHSKGDDTRSPSEIAAMRKRDWYTLYHNRFPEVFENIASEVQQSLTQLVADVDSRPLTRWSIQ